MVYQSHPAGWLRFFCQGLEGQGVNGSPVGFQSLPRPSPQARIEPLMVYPKPPVKAASLYVRSRMSCSSTGVCQRLAGAPLRRPPAQTHEIMLEPQNRPCSETEHGLLCFTTDIFDNARSNPLETRHFRVILPPDLTEKAGFVRNGIFCPKTLVLWR